ncbi:MAG: diguanylate cyclase [Clostridium sp.]|nr:diguanylate cyclase [Clostridium sp.]
MRMINGRYRIIDLITKNRTYSIYDAIDLDNESRKVNVYIINSSLIEKDLLDYLISKFEKISKRNSDSIKIEDFGALSNRNSKSETRDYYYVTESMELYTPILDYVENSSETELIHIFSKICNVAYSQSQSYFKIIPFQIENIYISNNKDIKLKDEITNLLECNEMGLYNFYSRLEEKIESNNADRIIEIDYINNLSYILNTISLVNKRQNKDVVTYKNVTNQMIHGDYEKYKELLGERLYELMVTVYNKSVNNKYEEIFNVLDDINNIYKTSYKYDSSVRNDKLSFDIPLIGRAEELELILKYINDIYRNNKNRNIVLVHGEIGVGKTRLLDHIEYINSNNNNIDCIYLSGKRQKDIITNVLQDIVNRSDKNLLNKYKKELVALGMDINDNKIICKSEGNLLDNRSKLMVIVKITTLFEEYYSDKKGLILIDNVDEYDEFDYSIIQYIMGRESIHDKLAVILSYRDGDCLNNRYFTKFIDEIKNNINLNIHLRPLSEEKCVLMLKNILNVNDISQNFVNTFYKYSMGNPLFIESALKDLIDRNKIYFDNNLGRWRREDNPQIYMPTNMEDVCKNQLKNIDGLAYDVLYYMSFFYMPISTEVLSQVLATSKDRIQAVVNDLLIQGILYSSICDSGFVYSFYNKFLRNYLYQQVNFDDIQKTHKRIYEILNNYYKKDKNTYIEEIIYHLEKLNSKEKLIPYYKENQRRLLQINSVQEAINCNIKIISIIDDLEDSTRYIEDRIEANISLTSLYESSSEKDKCIECYKEAIDLCLDNEKYKKCVNIMNDLIWNYMETGNEEEAIQYTKKMKSIIDKIDYKEGYIKYIRILVRNEYSNENYIEARRLSNYAITLCKDDLKSKVPFTNYYADCLIYENNFDKALEIIKETIKECKINNYIEPMSKLYNSLGVIYSDYIQCGKEGIGAFETQYELTKDDPKRGFGTNSLANMGFVYYVLLDYKRSFEYLNEASKRAMQLGLVYDIFYGYVYMGSVMFKIGNYYEAFKYANLCENYAKKNSMFNQEMLPYKILQYYISSFIGDSSSKEKFLIEGSKIYNETNSIMKYKIDLLYLIDRFLDDKESVTIDSIVAASEKIIYIDLRVSMLSQAIFKMINDDKISTAKELYLYINQFKDKIEKDENVLVLNYLGCCLVDTPNLDILVENLNNYSEIKNPDILWRIYLLIGEKYYIANNLTYATIYLSEACDTILSILKQIPINHKKSFILNNRRMLKAYEMLLDLKRYYNKAITYDSELISFNVDENIEELFQIIIESDFINEEFMWSVKQQSWKMLENISGVEDLLNNLSNSVSDNIELICKYICYICLAKKASIIVEKENKFSVFASSDKSLELPDDMSIINMARSRATEIKMTRKIISDGYGNNFGYENEGNIKAAMCIPITAITKSNRGISKYEYNHNVLGYIYIESERKLNNINDETMKKCITISRILYMILDKNNIRKSSTVDKLTNTLTRRYLEQFIHDQIDRSLNLNSEFSTIMIDIDKFKGINDTYGHRTGDLVLQNLCKVAIKNIRHDDVIGRYGGEEFIVVLPNTGLDQAFVIAERIRNKIIEAKLMGEKRIVTVSLGVSTYPLHASTYEELIEKADQALYMAKNSGRNRTRIWNESYGSKISTTNKLSGIFVGTGNQDYRNVSTVIEFIDMINEDIKVERKIEITVNRIFEITDADICILFLFNGENLEVKYSCVSSNVQNSKDELCDEHDLIKIIESGENVCGVDWSYIKECKEGKIPNLKSNMVIPLKTESETIGVLYLSVDINRKEFTYDELNFINTLAKVMVPMLNSK